MTQETKISRREVVTGLAAVAFTGAATSDAEAFTVSAAIEQMVAKVKAEQDWDSGPTGSSIHALSKIAGELQEQLNRLRLKLKGDPLLSKEYGELESDKVAQLTDARANMGELLTVVRSMTSSSDLEERG